MRYAIYFAPSPTSALARFGHAWLGREAESGGEVAPPPLKFLTPERLRALTRSPRRYGLHATLKPPFHLAPGRDADGLLSALTSFAATRAPVTLPRLALSAIDGFLALTPPTAVPAVHGLASACVRVFDAFRAPPNAAETERRRAAGLSPRQEALLAQWGYPFVMEEFRFHVTLSDRLDADQRALLIEELRPLLAPLLAAPLVIDSLALFAEPEADAPFRLHARVPLTGAETGDRQPAARTTGHGR